MVRWATVTDRERLIEILKLDPCPSPYLCDGNCKYANLKQCYEERTADYLLEHGVIVLPCKVGDTYYTIQKYCNTDPLDTEKEPVMPWDCENYCCRADCSFKEYRIDEHRFDTVGFILSAKGKIGKTIFLIREEAEKALKERENNA